MDWGSFLIQHKKFLLYSATKFVAFMNFLMCLSEKQLLALSLVLSNDIKADYPQPFWLAAVSEPLHP